jgi:hypothetical protein
MFASSIHLMKIKSIYTPILNVFLSGITAIAVVNFYPPPESPTASLARQSGAIAPARELKWDLVCASTPSNQIFARTELFFGLNKPNGRVSEAEFQRFLASEVTPRFPHGLTLLSGWGQFKNSQNIIEREPSKLLILLYPIEDNYSSQKIQEIRTAYKAMFQQESVLQAGEISCVSF